jgi:hypothetical protein
MASALDCAAQRVLPSEIPSCCLAVDDDTVVCTLCEASLARGVRGTNATAVLKRGHMSQSEFLKAIKDHCAQAAAHLGNRSEARAGPTQSRLSFKPVVQANTPAPVMVPCLGYRQTLIEKHQRGSTEPTILRPLEVLSVLEPGRDAHGAIVWYSQPHASIPCFRSS